MFAVAGVAVLVVVAALAFPRRLPPPDANARPEVQPDLVEQPVADATETSADVAAVPSPEALEATAPRVVVAAAAVPAVKTPSKKPAAPRPEERRIAESAKPVAPVAAMPLVEAPKEDALMKLAALEPVPVAPALASASPAIVGPPPVTIVGCLEISVSEDEFRLTDTEGDAPKSRNWRTGFLKKRRAAVALVEPPQGLRTDVGKRVAATGVLTSRELKVSSVRVVGPSCN
jgi:hypothetical protein